MDRIVRDIRSAAPQDEINTDFTNSNTLLVYARELSHVMNREPYMWDCECEGFDYLKNTYIDRIELRPFNIIHQDRSRLLLEWSARKHRHECRMLGICVLPNVLVSILMSSIAGLG